MTGSPACPSKRCAVPRVFISYAQDGGAHSRRVLELADRLRAEGIDCHLDQYEMEQAPPRSWPAWMVEQIERAEYVLMVFTPAYTDRFLGRAEGAGLGARWEGAIVLQELYEGETERFIPIVFGADEVPNIPVVLRGVHHYLVGTQEGYDRLYRRLTNQPLVTRPALGPVRELTRPATPPPRRIYGIDLGTTYSCLAHCGDDGRPAVIPNAEGELITPSVVYFEGPYQIVVGREAKSALRADPDHGVALVKREMGNPTYHFEAYGKSYAPEELSALILRKLVADARAATGEDIRDVVITCPAYFGNNERGATKNAGELAGLTVHQVLNEPTAAAICYGLETDTDQVVLVYDLGGGTFDVTLIAVRQGCVQVVCTGGDFQLGGKDFDDQLVGYLAEQFQAEHPEAGDPRDEPQGLADLWAAAEEAKRALTARESLRQLVVFNGQRSRVEVSRDKFEELSAPLLNRTLDMTRQVLAEARKHDLHKVDQVLLVGGSSRMPAVARKLKGLLQVEPRLFEPDLAVAKGAALVARNLLAGKLLREEVAKVQGTPAAEVRLERVEPAVLEEAAREVVAHSGQFRLGTSQSVREMARAQVVDVASKGFGVLAKDREGQDQVCFLISQNTPLPAEKLQIFGTNEERQREVVLEIMEQAGELESARPAHNRLLGRGVISGLPALRPGSPIHVTFRLEEDGTLTVTALEPSSGRDLRLTFQVEGILSEEQVREKRGALLQIAVN